MKIKRIYPARKEQTMELKAAVGIKEKLEGEIESKRNMFMGEVAGICSLIFLSDSYVIKSAKDAILQSILACHTERGFGQILLYAFHPELHPEVTQFLIDAGWAKLTQWQSAHPGNPPMELWSIHTGQEQH